VQACAGGGGGNPRRGEKRRAHRGKGDPGREEEETGRGRN
jgi:hypothetical protein